MRAKSFFDLGPIAFGGLFGLIVAVGVIFSILNFVRQILLLYPVAGEIVRVEIALVAFEAGSVGVDVLQLARDVAGSAGLDIGDRGVDGHTGRIGLRRGGEQDDCVGQRQARLGQAELQCRVDTRLDDGDGLWIGKADVLAGRAKDAAAGAGQVAGLQKAGEIVQRGVRVGAAERLHQGREVVIVVIACAVVAHGRDLRELRRVGKRQVDRAVRLPSGGEEQLDGVGRFAEVAAAGLCDALERAVLADGSDAVLFFEKVNGTPDALEGFLRRDGLELKDRGAGEDRVVDIEIGIFCCGGDERDLAVFDVFQQRLLLLF